MNKKRRFGKKSTNPVPAVIVPPPPVQSRNIYTPKVPPPWIESSSLVKKSHFLFTPPRAPEVLYADIAWSKLQLAIQHCAKEVGWMGTVEKNEHTGNYIITDIIVPPQEVSAASTEIDHMALVEWADSHEYDTDKLRYWGHSHVNMGVSPSIQDERQIQEYMENRMLMYDDTFFIRGIYNKSGDAKVDVYIKNNEDMGWIHECVNHGRIQPAFSNADDFIAGINRDVRVYTPPPIKYKSNDKTDYTKLGDMYGLSEEDARDAFGRPLYDTGTDLGFDSPESAQALMDELDLSEDDVKDPFVAKGK